MTASKKSDSIQLTSGLMPGQVLQRNDKNRGQATLMGKCLGPGVLQTRIISGRKTVREWTSHGKLGNDKFKITLEKIPVGGPYCVTLRLTQGRKVIAQTELTDVFVGDVWILGGQSNMQGVGNREDAPASHPKIRAFYMRDEWDIADEPLHLLGEAVDRVHNDGVRLSAAEALQMRKDHQKGVGPGLFFAKEMLKRTGIPQGLIICAHGGTSMDQWNPDLKDKGGASLYGAMYRRFMKLGQPVKGMLWYQGESDATPGSSKSYTDKMIKLVAATRKDFKQPRLPWLVVQIGRVIGWGEDSRCWNSIQEQQRLLPKKIHNLGVIPTIDLGLDDTIHISGKDQAVVGRRLACIADRLALGNRKEKDAIRLKSVKQIYRSPALSSILNGIEVAFSNVKGGLQSTGRPHGFTITDGAGKAESRIFKTQLYRNKVILQTNIESNSRPDLLLHYGCGFDPFCNITDQRGMGLPVLGPVKLQGDGGTPFLKSWQTSKPKDTKGGIAKLSYTKAKELLNHAGKPFENASFYVKPQDPAESKPGIMMLKSVVECKDDINVILALGSDGPFKAWLNGKPVLSDPKAVNPIIPDQYKNEISLKKGRNLLVIAFDGRSGSNWGVCARFLPRPPKQAIPDDMIAI